MNLDLTVHDRQMTARERSERRAAIAFVAPAVLTLAALTVGPALWVVWLSLRDRVPVFEIDRFAGLAHYAFLASDPRFWSAARVTLTFTVVSVALELLLGLGVALVLRGQRAGRRSALALLLLAWALPGVVTARVFEWLYQPTAGIVNVVLGLTLNWLGDPRLAMPALILADVWSTMPFVALFCYARLLTIPQAVYEAAAVDGATGPATFRYVTLPLLAPVLLVTLLFRTLDALRAFDIMFVLTGGGPAGLTETLTVYAYRSLFQTLRLGFGSALGVIVFVLVMAVASIYLRALQHQEAGA
jgi:multiple sugar transport system permease protein